MRYLIIVLCAMIELYACVNSGTEEEMRLCVNQLGYIPSSVKEFVVENPSFRQFDVLDAESGQIVFTGTLEAEKKWEPAGSEKFAKGVFSEVTRPGSYTIKCGQAESSVFVIKDDIFTDALKAGIKSYYYQRCSEKLPEAYAGKWAREAGHPDVNLKFHESMNRMGTLDSPGGWYDAGDYGKYTVNAGITLLTMLMSCELCPHILDLALNIPKSELSSVPDIVIEMKYELDWLKTMQDGDGGVFFKIGPKQFPGMIRPEADHLKRYVIGKSTTSALNFAAVMAKAGSFLRPWYPDYSADCRKSAVSAYQWAEMHPDIPAPDEGGGTGLYGDRSYADEFLTAAVELYLSTENKKYGDYVKENIQSFSIEKPAAWDDIANFAFFEVVHNEDKFDSAIFNYAQRALIEFSDIILHRMETNVFSIPMLQSDFIWGSNSVLLNYGMTVAVASRINQEQQYRDALPLFLDYIFGKNPTGYCFVTGFGKVSPMFIHHRPSAGDTIKEPVPGFLVGGPNKDMQDGKANYLREEPARAYTDVTASFASNEVAINWNAVLVFMLAAAWNS
ncbi:MAG: glycoside hydrolase family 9 protein [Spirochaetales bacterium]|nr:glycoside hydrolase family 9 protein [Spirochaetales bacterium]